MNVLVVVDMQNDFIDGSLGTKEAQQIVSYVKDKIARHNGELIFTRDTHNPDYLATKEGVKLPIPHCIKDSHGWKIHKELVAENTDALIIDKPTFGSSELVKHLKHSNHFSPTTDKIELIGLCTDICVISNALLLKTYFYETDIIVDARGCAGVTPESHHNALSAMKMCQIEVINDDYIPTN